MEEKRVFLLPGEVYVSREPVEIATLLGSCVAICLFNRKHNFGGMNHFMLPLTPKDEIPSGKHGDYSSEILIKMMLSYDDNKNNIDASILGGGRVTGHLSAGEGIGAKNIITARNILEKQGINVVQKSIGGDFGRKVYFKNWTGELDIRKIERSSESRLIEDKVKDISKRKIKVLVVDDSRTVRDIISNAISSDPQIEVIGQAADAYEARELLLELNPDVICLDIIMPRMDGITFLKKIFLYNPKPVIIISTVAQKGSALREQAFKIGAVDVIDKEDLALYSKTDRARTILVSKVKSASVVLVRNKSKEDLETI